MLKKSVAVLAAAVLAALSSIPAVPLSEAFAKDKKLISASSEFRRSAPASLSRSESADNAPQIREKPSFTDNLRKGKVSSLFVSDSGNCQFEEEIPFFKDAQMYFCINSPGENILRRAP